MQQMPCSRCHAADAMQQMHSRGARRRRVGSGGGREGRRGTYQRDDAHQDEDVKHRPRVRRLRQRYQLVEAAALHRDTPQQDAQHEEGERPAVLGRVAWEEESDL
eukprot:4842598-Prymnesium_polylepis.1